MWVLNGQYGVASAASSIILAWMSAAFGSDGDPEPPMRLSGSERMTNHFELSLAMRRYYPPFRPGSVFVLVQL